MWKPLDQLHICFLLMGGNAPAAKAVVRAIGFGARAAGIELLMNRTVDRLLIHGFSLLEFYVYFSIPTRARTPFLK